MSETIVTGKKYRILTDVAQKIWQRVSFWTKSSDVEFDDGKTAETKVGAIDGITDSLVSTSSNIAASAKAVSELNGNFASFQQSFRVGCSTIAAAITEMGVATANNASPGTMASNIKKLSAKVLALSHSNQGKDTTIYTSDRNISGLTLIASDTGTNCVLKVNGVTQTRKHTQALSTVDNFGYMTYDSTLSLGDVVSVYTSAGGGFDVILLDRIL